MGVHANAKLGPAGRRELVRLIRDGASERQAAARLSVALATARRWSVRERDASPAERACGAWALDRSSRPRRCPCRTSVALERRVCEARERTGWGPRLLVAATGVAHSTISAILKRYGCSRVPRPPRDEVVRYEWPCPGDLLHMDVKRYPRFRRPGHALTGDRRAKLQRRNPLGQDYSTPSSMTTHGWPMANCSVTKRRPRSPPSSSAPWPGLPTTPSARSG